MPTHAKKFLIGQRFIFDPNDNSLIDKLENNELIRLGSNESRALSLLIEDPSLIITRQRIHDYVWREQGFEVDDSSLTQAISTLRKALKDSTKSPAFVKTVPKRGYQIIATVDPYVDEEGMDSNVAAQETLPHPEHISPLDTPSVDVTDSEIVEQITEAESSIPPSIETKPKITWLGWIALAIALILPVVVNLSMPPKSAAFRPLLQVEGVKIYTPISNPVMKDWNNMISSCVSDYLKNHQDEGKPTEVIVTGGQNNQLYLNYLHSSSVPMENITLRLLTSHEDNVKLCQ
ncbi:transcriptional regulator [Photobacterium sp. GB-27]|uniref:winged helix-turn-helix domain-containing protein n=1 Tax=unclassified Photobacterium TaxID=2628852 RepID=UPI000D1649ED|nr:MULTISPECIES: transcriptional regulator [unclassified Photobacterium]PSV28832.1 transcriptional regulator [Photobacterium sp. GB-56]PSV33317.1 transcriptional regulator [Photobacterium sp. GB-72]PSV39422.1 transcriptional regulator [Photobacterium sp. GB-27]PSV40723.1 transcriptional regulator [Photobacterium sp. GB-210]PSV46475.1 transcriptional regulator [Photobacterium sp. GB-36]